MSYDVSNKTTGTLSKVTCTHALHAINRSVVSRAVCIASMHGVCKINVYIVAIHGCVKLRAVCVYIVSMVCVK